jgi:hypothetical protein
MVIIKLILNTCSRELDSFSQGEKAGFGGEYIEGAESVGEE